MFAERSHRNGSGNGSVEIERGFDGTGYFKKNKEISRSESNDRRMEFIRKVKEAGGVHPRFTKKMMIE